MLPSYSCPYIGNLMHPGMNVQPTKDLQTVPTLHCALCRRQRIRHQGNKRLPPAAG